MFEDYFLKHHLEDLTGILKAKEGTELHYPVFVKYVTGEMGCVKDVVGGVQVVMGGVKGIVGLVGCVKDVVGGVQVVMGK